MGARLINNPRRTKIGHVEAFPVLHMRSLRKSAMFSEGQRTEGHFLYPGASNAITIIVDLRSEHDLKVLLEVGHTDSATNMQVIGLTHRPTGFHGRRWYFVSASGERAEALFLVEGFFRTRTDRADISLLKNIKGGVLQIIASQLVRQTTQECSGESEIRTGITEY